MKIKILHFSVFLGQVKRHGGVKRSEQLAEALSVFDAVSINPYVELKKVVSTILISPLVSIEVLFFGFYLLLFHGLSLLGFIKFVLRTPYLIKVMKKYEFDFILLETSLGVSIPFMRYLKWKKIKYVAAPHNVEFLVPFQTRSVFRDKKHLFASEAYGLKRALEVLAICEYDLSILRNLEVNVSLYPYYPVKPDLLRFELIKLKREANQLKNSFLLLGSVFNVPTYEGVKEILDELRLDDTDSEFKVAGFGTECFKDYENDNLHILGSLSDDELDGLLVSVKGVLINQPQTTGFLTKIIDFNKCGIPMYVTSGYYQAKNMEEYGIFIINKLKHINSSRITTKVSSFEPPVLSDIFYVASVQDSVFMERKLLK